MLNAGAEKTSFNSAAIANPQVIREATAKYGAVSVPVIASGGVGNLDHLADGVSIGGADAVLAASIFHYGEDTVQQAKQRMLERGMKATIPYSENSHTTAPETVQLNMAHPPRMTLLALAWRIGAADKR